MKRLLPVAVSLAGCALLFAQAPLGRSIKELRQMNAIPPTATSELIRAQSKILLQQDVLLKATEAAKTDPNAQQAAAAAQKQLEDAQKAAADAAQKAAAAPPQGPKFVPQAQREHLMSLVTAFYQEVVAEAKSAEGWELWLFLAGVACGALATILSAFSLNKFAAIASAFVVVAGAVPKFYPVHQRAVYYRTLTNQSYSLMSCMNIPFQLTSAEYDDGARRLQILEDYRATKYPETADVDSTTQELFKELNANKTAAVEAH